MSCVYPVETAVFRPSLNRGLWGRNPAQLNRTLILLGKCDLIRRYANDQTDFKKLSNATSVSSDTWCSIPSASARATSSPTPIDVRNSTTI